MGGRGGSGGSLGNGGGLAKLAGTAKQIEWATEIRKNINGIFDDVKKEITSAGWATSEQKKQEISFVESTRKRINSATSAGDIIDLFKNVRRTNNVYDDYDKVMAPFNVSVAKTEGQKKILGR